MNENKTKPTDRDIADFIGNLPNNQQDDAELLVEMMQDISGEPPIVWGSKIVGFGKYHYTSKSGREGDRMKIGFAPGTNKFSLYLTYDAEKLTAQVKDLGRYKIGKGCVYINKLADVDQDRLRELIRLAYASGNLYG